MFELRESGDWDIFLGPPERARAETGGADQWVLKRRECSGFARVNKVTSASLGYPACELLTASCDANFVGKKKKNKLTKILYHQRSSSQSHHQGSRLVGVLSVNSQPWRFTNNILGLPHAHSLSVCLFL